eukprot:gnl/TRDRNA2_/TRDRNA2_133481_c0_seq1.p1 gnl/TRDRNA2_/TRDRNA2_133481_c0~~gnl/TRDRNA2_/TRDRNA2_133481_c0_seq1.p1  ORF type:complete len:565 (+),score=84.60 gnl/TRDRNA2_/TRDRNA2_133481_c0_seq1:150-1844(+)
MLLACAALVLCGAEGSATAQTLSLNTVHGEGPTSPSFIVDPMWTQKPFVASGVSAIPTYLDQVNPRTMARNSPIHKEVFARIKELAADHIRYLHWDPFPTSFPLPHPPVNNKTSWDFSGIDPYVEDFMTASEGHDSVINFAPMYTWGTNDAGFLDPTGTKAGEYFSRIISWYTKGGFVDELGVKHVSNYSYNWTYWEVLNEPDAGSSGLRCRSLNNSANALLCAQKYIDIYDGIVTVLKRDHPQLKFTALVIAFPDCAGSQTWFSHFLNASNHRSPVREHFSEYVHEISYHWYAENYYLQNDPPDEFLRVGANPSDLFMQSAQFLVAAKRIKDLVDELAPGTRMNCNEVGVLVVDPPEGALLPNGADRWWWNLEASMFAYVYSQLAALGVDAIAASQLTGYPGNAEPISMLDWTSGKGNPYYWVVKMFIDTMGSGPKDVHDTTVNLLSADKLINASMPDDWKCIHSMQPKGVGDAHVSPLYARAMTLHAKAGQRVVILANTRKSSISVSVAGAAGGSVRTVEKGSGDQTTPYSDVKMTSEELTLEGWGVAIVSLPSAAPQAFWV